MSQIILEEGTVEDGTIEDGTVEVGADEATAMTRALTRISVDRPYFALESLEELGHGLVTAAIPPANPPAPEVGAIEAAQVARHLAILGSCAAALARDDDARHHYLATRAHYTRLSNAPTATDEPLRAEAIASWADRRTARALVKLTTESGRGLNLLDVDYTVLTPKVFRRFNPPSEQPPSADQVDAAELGFDVTDIADGVRVQCGPVPAVLCAGHFPDQPAAPVAIVMGQLCRAAGLAMNRHLGTPEARYRIEEGHVEASKLGQAGQRLDLEARYLQPVRGGHLLEGTAFADGDVIGQVRVTLSAHGPEPIEPPC